jgi:predicted deacylase
MLKSGMLELPDGVEPAQPKEAGRAPVFANASKWVRAPDGGIFRTLKKIGHAVSEGETIGWVANPYDDTQSEIRAPRRGIIVGSTTLPIVNMGDALFHIAWSKEYSDSRSTRDEVLEPGADPLMDEDEII